LLGQRSSHRSRTSYPAGRAATVIVSRISLELSSRRTDNMMSPSTAAHCPSHYQKCPKSSPARPGFVFSFSSRYRHLAATRRQKMLSGLSSVAVYEWLHLQMMCTTMLRSTGLQVLLNPNWAPSGLHCAVRLAVHRASASSPWRACRHALVVYREFTSCPRGAWGSS
jgi:hypothetical protein